MHEELLAKVVSEWTATKVLPDLITLLGTVWRTNVERHEPDLGDDAVTLGMGSARNFANRTVRDFALRQGVLADLQNNSLRVVHQGRTLRASKLPGKSAHADPLSIVWDTSAAKQHGPLANSQQMTLFTLPEEDLLANTADLQPHYLHLAWAGDPESGDITVYLGFPRDNADGGSPWFAVQLVHRDEIGGQLPITVGAPDPYGDRFDQRPIPEVPVRLREVEPREADLDRG
ncbi:hypothetical protein Kfla_4650 [Kribbella flavida DSM 17836]|uniref:Uncharacterized protein n=1 Tax=Kribbella flavida (strain DSM 17836 / JCM 10339 / NBRC 14399) TaxID=479435 RepID=D2PY62_KRIFD|nr:hypothetical protein [Kribbella flavida]ADB33668.1 hypothetical protein Kfla_4650 [Kribbella flavida DSM 17836]